MNKRSELSLVLTSKQYRNSGRMCRKYKYLIQTYGCTSFHAFVGRKAFRNWMKERGLALGERTGKRTFKIIGTYYDVYAQPLPTKGCFASIALHNGTYTDCMIGETENGERVVYHRDATEAERADIAAYRAHDARMAA